MGLLDILHLDTKEKMELLLKRLYENEQTHLAVNSILLEMEEEPAPSDTDDDDYSTPFDLDDDDDDYSDEDDQPDFPEDAFPNLLDDPNDPLFSLVAPSSPFSSSPANSGSPAPTSPFSSSPAGSGFPAATPPTSSSLPPKPTVTDLTGEKHELRVEMLPLLPNP